MAEHQNNDLSEPLNPGAQGSVKLDAKKLSEWMASTNCYPKETVYAVHYSKLTPAEKVKRDEEVAHAKAQPPEALL